MLSVTATAIRQALDKPNRAHAGEIWRKVADRGGGSDGAHRVVDDAGADA